MTCTSKATKIALIGNTRWLPSWKSIRWPIQGRLGPLVTVIRGCVFKAYTNNKSPDDRAHARTDQGLYSAVIYSTVSKNCISGKQWPWSDYANAQSDLGLRGPHMPRHCYYYYFFFFYFPGRKQTLTFHANCLLQIFINFQSFVVVFFSGKKRRKLFHDVCWFFLPSMISFNILTEHCEEGKQYNWTSGGCDPCEKGFFKANRSSRETCIPCPINTVARRKGADRCEGSLC